MEAVPAHSRWGDIHARHLAGMNSAQRARYDEQYAQARRDRKLERAEAEERRDNSAVQDGPGDGRVHG